MRKRLNTLFVTLEGACLRKADRRSHPSLGTRIETVFQGGHIAGRPKNTLSHGTRKWLHAATSR